MFINIFKYISLYYNILSILISNSMYLAEISRVTHLNKFITKLNFIKIILLLLIIKVLFHLFIIKITLYNGYRLFLFILSR